MTMDAKLLSLLVSGAELRVPSLDMSFPIDFIVVGDKSTLVFRSDWWQKENEQGVGVVSIDATPEPVGDGTWTFRHVQGYLLAPPGDEDQDKALRDSRTRAHLAREIYVAKLATWVEAESEHDFRPWIEHVMSLPTLQVEDLARTETAEREVGIIRLRDLDSQVVDTLVIDENGLAATAAEDGHLTRFAEQWMSYAEGQRPPLNDFLVWLSTVEIYEGLTFADLKTVSGSGDVQEIALRAALG